MKLHPYLFSSLSARVRALLAALVMLCGLSLTASSTPERQAPPDDAAMFIRSERSAVLLHTGREEILQFRLARAEETFSELANRQDGKVAGAFYLVTISFLRFSSRIRGLRRTRFASCTCSSIRPGSTISTLSSSQTTIRHRYRSGRLSIFILTHARRGGDPERVFRTVTQDPPSLPA